jgi:hypothetical protein
MVLKNGRRIDGSHFDPDDHESRRSPTTGVNMEIIDIPEYGIIPYQEHFDQATQGLEMQAELLSLSMNEGTPMKSKGGLG